jgi:hypothetical protein
MPAAFTHSSPSAAACHFAKPPCGRGIVRPLIPRGDTHFAQEARGAPRLPPCWWRRGGAKSPDGSLWVCAAKTASVCLAQLVGVGVGAPSCDGPSLMGSSFCVWSADQEQGALAPAPTSCATSTTIASRLGSRALNGGAPCPAI